MSIYRYFINKIIINIMKIEDIKVSGSNMSVGPALTEYIQENLFKTIDKYFKDAVYANVFVSKNKRKEREKEMETFSIKITVNEGIRGGGIDIQGDALDIADAKACANEAIEKVDKQLRRYKRKIKDRRKALGVKAVNSEISDRFADNAETILLSEEEV